VAAGSADITCFSCGTKLTVPVPVSRREECPKCRNDVRVCKNCRFYDSKVYNECQETSAEVIREKDRSNICDYFQPRAGAGAADKKTDLLAAAEALFKKNSE
jgi:hypothetical protein